MDPLHRADKARLTSCRQDDFNGNGFDIPIAAYRVLPIHPDEKLNTGHRQFAF